MRPARGEFKALPQATLAAALRMHLPGQSWSELRALCTSGKISVRTGAKPPSGMTWPALLVPPPKDQV